MADTAGKIATLETKLFGDSPLLGPDGRPYEKGSGSYYASDKHDPKDRALLDALYALQDAEAAVAKAEAAKEAAAAKVKDAQKAVDHIISPPKAEEPKRSRFGGRS